MSAVPCFLPAIAPGRCGQVGSNYGDVTLLDQIRPDRPQGMKKPAYRGYRFSPEIN